ncbi:type VII toxin-antitoxin system MntA family adenylyltransferase antitoxin [Halovivax cerinus]|uniref:Nucleotidyltransferase family protein n=1 Tax=Halovivax cerinus TaxID=1487865 RepID=A0ABD5NQ28_9EURY|nr:nucleotidyltransferase domain-containing protein [Halovivax cerinus]
MGDRFPPAADGRTDGGSGNRSLDLDTIRGVLADRPVRLAVLFGSQATGITDAQSDVDIAVELMEEAHGDASQIRMELLVALSIALDRNDIDLSLISDLTPRVGLAAFTEGQLIVGSTERMRHHRHRFERRVTEQGQDDLRERFDAVLENVDAAVGEGA